MDFLIPLKLNEMCRICIDSSVGSPMRTKQSLFDFVDVPLFSAVQRIQIAQILEVVVQHLPKVQMNDDLPKRICSVCVEKLLSFYGFQNNCIASDQRLRKALVENVTVQPPILSLKSEVEFEDFSVNTETSSDVEIIIHEVKHEKTEDSEGNMVIYFEDENEDRPPNDDANSKFPQQLTIKKEIYSEIEDLSENSKALGPLVEEVKYIIEDKNHGEVTGAVAKEYMFDCTEDLNKVGESTSNHEELNLTNPQKNKPAKDNVTKKVIWFCKVCSKEFFYKYALIKHMRDKKNCDSNCNNKKIKKILNCFFCDRNFCSKQNLQNHMMNIHNIDTRENVSSIATKNVVTENQNERLKNTSYESQTKSLINYAKIQSSVKILDAGDEINKTKECLDKAFIEGLIEETILIQTQKKDIENAKSLTCDICSKVFKKRTFLRHLLSTHGIEINGKELNNFHSEIDCTTWTCDVCNNSFKTFSSFLRHKLIHVQKSGFKCSYCKKEFTEARRLRKHKRFHTSEKKHQCHYCPKKFHIKGGLHNHLRTHFFANTYECNLCPVGFRNLDYLEAHKDSHKTDGDKNN